MLACPAASANEILPSPFRSRVRKDPPGSGAGAGAVLPSAAAGAGLARAICGFFGPFPATTMITATARKSITPARAPHTVLILIVLSSAGCVPGRVHLVTQSDRCARSSRLD